ncbi:MAG TPA: hypothetical protein VLA90_08120 [Actinomycetota bacterium]|nr:hypothetical protein [Actinomycetota bacterium]
MSLVRKSPRAVATYDPVVRWKARAWALVAYLAVLSAVAGIVLFAVRYEPLSAAERFSASGPVTADGPNMIRVGYVHEGTFSMGFLLVNDGPFPVKIQRIQMTGQNALMVPVGLETAAKRYAGSLTEGDPSLDKFLPFTLAGGDRRWIVLRTRFGNCGRFAAGSFETYTRFQVTYKVLAFTKHASVPLPKAIRVDSPPDSGCPTRAA